MEKALDLEVLQRRYRRNVWIVPVFVFAVLGLIMAGLYLLLEYGERQRLFIETEIAAEQIRGRLEAWVDVRNGVTGLIAEKISGTSPISKDDFWYESVIAQHQFPGFQTLNYIDTDWILRKVVPANEEVSIFGQGLQNRPFSAISPVIERIQQTGKVARSQVVNTIPGQKGFGTFWPVYDAQRNLVGYVVGVFNIDTIVKGCLNELGLQDRFWFKFREKAGEPFYVHGHNTDSNVQSYQIHLPVRIVDLAWTLEIAPSPPMIAQVRNWTNEMVLGVGILFSAVLAGLLRSLFFHQENLLLSKEKYRLVVENVNDAIVILQDDRLGFFNRRFAELLGYEPEVLATLEFRDIFSPGGLEVLFQRRIKRRQKESVQDPYEIVLRKKDGNLVYIEASDTVIDESDKNAAFAVFRDITDRKQAERERETLQRLSQGLTGPLSVKELGVIIAEESRHLFGHDAFFLDLYDESTQSYLGIYYEDTPPESLEPVEVPAPQSNFREMSGVQKLINHGEPPEKSDFIPFGYTSRRSLSLMFVPVWWELRPIGVLSVQSYTPHRYNDRDLLLLQTFANQCGGALARVRATEANARLVMAVENAAEAIVVTDACKNILYVNPACEKISGYCSEEVIGKPFQLFNDLSLPALFDQEIRDPIFNRDEVWAGRFKSRKKEGTSYEEEGTISPVRNAEGQVVNYVIVKRDITQEQALEAQLRHAQKMEAVGQLAGGVAHDFNNLLQVILGHTEQAMNSVAEGEKAYHYLLQNRKAAEKAALLTRQLLAFGRRQVLQPVDLDLNQVIVDLMKMIRRVIGENIELEFIPEIASVCVHADQGQIEQILLNLCINARDAMPEGGKITIKTGNIVINGKKKSQPSLAAPGRYSMLSIADCGAGIPPEIQDRIFEPFFTTKEQGKGTGLGLATVYGIVKQHEGYIQVESNRGKGTCFQIYLPEVLRRPVPIPKQQTEPVSGGSETILLAEDDEMVQQMTLDILKEAGYRILVAENGEEAVRIFKDHSDQIDLLMMDLVMPRLGGIPAAEQIRAIRPDIPVLFCSGYSVDAHEIGQELSKNLMLIQKPYHISQLLQKIREILDLHSNRIQCASSSLESGYFTG